MIFIDDEFLNMGDIDRSLELHKIVGQKECTLSDIVENDEKILKLLKIMRMTCLQVGVYFLINHNNFNCTEARESIPYYHFEIERKTFIVASHDDDEPKTIHEALSSSTKYKWIKALNDKLESMKLNQVWNLVDLLSGHKVIENK